MSIARIAVYIMGMLITQVALSVPPVEVIDSCKNGVAASASVTITQVSRPLSLGDNEPGCLDHYESTVNNFNYGYITCQNKTSLIIKGNRISLSTAENHSVNPAIIPDGDILPLSYWWKIDFHNSSYLCINTPLSSSGSGDNILQHYIVENAYNNNPTSIYFYFFNKDIIPISAINNP